jgi:hypothetical protein
MMYAMKQVSYLLNTRMIDADMENVSMQDILKKSPAKKTGEKYPSQNAIGGYEIPVKIITQKSYKR